MFYFATQHLLTFPGGPVVKKNLPANAGDAGDACSIPGSGRFPGEGNGYQSSILAWRTSWAEVPCGLQSLGLQTVGHD